MLVAERFGGRRVVAKQVGARPVRTAWLAKIAGRIGVIAAGATIVGVRTSCCGTHRGATERSGADRSGAVWGPAIPGTASDVRTMPYANSTDATNANSPAADEAAAGMEATEAASVEATSVEPAEAEAIDEKCRRPVAACQLAFEHVDVEG